MKLRNLLLTGLAAVGFLACSNDDDLGRDGGKAAEGDAYASFTVDTRGLNLYTRAGELEETGTEEEQAVKKVIAVMYDNSDVVAHQLEEIYESENSTKVKLKAQSVKQQDYKVAIIVNPTDDVVGLTKTGKHMSLLLDGMAKDLKDASMFTNKGIMMSNANGLKLVKASELQKTEDEANEKPINISVDRVVAKVNVSLQGDKLETNGADEVTLKGWALDVTNKKSYYLRKAALDMDGNEETSSTERAKRYAKDPNFKLQTFSGVSFVKRLIALSDNFNYLGYGLPADYTMDDKYVLENTFEKGQVSKGEATRVVLEADYLPVGIDQEAAKEGWFSYKDKKMSIEEFSKNFDEALTAEWDATIDGLNSSFVNEMKNLAIFVVYLNDLSSGEKIDEGGDAQFLGEDGKLLPEYKELLKVLNIGEITYKDLKEHINEKGVFSPIEKSGSLISKQEVKITVNTDASFHAGNLKFYKGAKSYYPVYIKHFDYSEEKDRDKLKEAYGYYGVVRNNVYNVKINSITKPGLPVVVPPAIEEGRPEISDRPTPDLDKPTSPDPENPDKPIVKPGDPESPDEPIIEDEFFISYDVEILPWFVRTQVEDL